MIPLSHKSKVLYILFLSLFLSTFPLGGKGFARTITPGVDTLECSIVSECYVCVDCCEMTSVYSMTMDGFDIYRDEFIMDTFYTGTVEPSLKKATDDIRNAFTFKTGAIGAFLDATIFLDTNRDLQVQATQTMQNYTVSDQVCKFGTLSKALVASDAKSEAAKLVLSEISLARSLGTTASVSAAGRGQDNGARLYTFVVKFCDLAENGSGLNSLCRVANPVVDTAQSRDVSFGRVLDDRVTLNGDFTDAADTQDETNVVAMSDYLYGHRQPTKRISYTELQSTPGRGRLYQEYRSIIARRAAAQNTFNTLAGMKSAGSGITDQYLDAALQALGLPQEEIPKYIGGQYPNNDRKFASYNGQMEMLTKKIYEDPAFYANLMESKVNTQRVSAAMQGVGLAQSRDIYRSIERSEMLMALLVELEARKATKNNQAPKGEDD